MGKCRPPTVEKCRPPKARIAKSSLSGRNYFLTMHHQAGVNFENFIEVKFRDILLTGKGHQDRRLNRESPGQGGTYGRSNLNQNLKPKPKSNFRFIRERPLAIPSFHQKCCPGGLPPPEKCRPGALPPPPLSGPCLSYTQTSSGNVENIQSRLESPRPDPFFDPSPPLFGFRPIFENHRVS